MAKPVSPVAKQIYVCDDVFGDPASGKVNIVNLWHTVRVPSFLGFPYRLAKLSVFVWWRDGYGKVKTWVEIVQASKESPIFRSRDYVIDFERRGTSIFARYTIEDFAFPAPGYYPVEMYCEGAFVDDQIIRVISD